MSPTLIVILGIIVLALTFDFFNGFHDAANSVATVVTTRVLSPMQAVLWAAFFNFVAAFVFGTGVAKTISEKLIEPHAVDIYVVLGGVVGAIVWDIITWLMALPTSSSHALISGFAGAAIAKGGFGVILVKGWIPVIVFLILSPLIGLILGYLIMTAVSWLSFRTERHRAQTISKSCSSFRRAPIAWATGRTTRRRRWALLWRYSSSAERKSGLPAGFNFLDTSTR